MNFYHLALKCIIFLIASILPAQQFQVLYTQLAESNSPRGSLLKVGNDLFYGTSPGGGDYGFGTIFKIKSTGIHTVIHHFDFDNGREPFGGLIIGNDGNLYGTTYSGGLHDAGTVYKLSLSGKHTVLFNFNIDNGLNPVGDLSLGNDGNLYGTTSSGGSNNTGTVFRISPNGSHKVLFSFDNAHGAFPFGGLTKGGDGAFYGTTFSGGSNDRGTVFKVSTTGVVVVLHDFDEANGASPTAPLLKAKSGDFYGTTQGGGSNNAGTVFKININGTHTLLYSLDSSGKDGLESYASLIEGNDGALYGSQSYGGINQAGVLFKVTKEGVYSVLHSFDNVTSGWPFSAPTIDNGTLYGMAGQSNGTGAVVWKFLLPEYPLFQINPDAPLAINPNSQYNVTLIHVSGEPPFIYRWRRNGTPISGATKSSYTIPSVQQSHEGSYDCVITNSYGSFTTPASVLFVDDPVEIVAHPLSQAANVGQDVALKVSAVGTEPMEFQWRKNGTPLPGENAFGLFLVADVNSGGLYDVVVTNPLGSVTSKAAALTVLIPPEITVQPLSQDVSVGSTAFFSVTASGTGLTYQWRRNGVDLNKQTGAMLMVSNVQKANEGVYDVVVKNSYGVVLSDPAWLTLPKALSITEHPQDVTASPGDTASFSVTANGQGTLTYQWNKDGKPIKDAKFSTLDVSVTDPTVAGAYSVTVSSGSLKATSAPAYLRVPEAGLLIYKFTLTGNSFEGTNSSKIAQSGLLVLDRLNQRGGIIRFGKNGKLDTFVTRVDDGLRTDSTGPATNSQTVVSKVVRAEESGDQKTSMLWLRGTDGLITFSNTDKTIAPKTLSGFQAELSLAGYTEVTSLNLTAILDNQASLQARQSGEILEQTLSRMAAGLQQKGFIRE